MAWPASPKPICRHFQAGECWYGGSCYYSHDVTQARTPDGRSLCSFYLKGVCMLGEACRFSHDEASMLAMMNSSGGAAEPDTEADTAQRVTCGICLEDLHVAGGVECDESNAKSQVASKFGMLPNCNHTFCLKCIKEWRNGKKKEVVSSFAEVEARFKCPVCRVHSDFVIPSFYHCEGERKEKAVARYRKQCSMKPCKYFAKNRRCPFKDNCLFGHKEADGTVVTGVQAPKLNFGARLRDVLPGLLQEALVSMELQDEAVDENIRQLIEQLSVIHAEFMSEDGDTTESAPYPVHTPMEM